MIVLIKNKCNPPAYGLRDTKLEGLVSDQKVSEHYFNVPLVKITFPINRSIFGDTKSHSDYVSIDVVPWRYIL